VQRSVTSLTALFFYTIQNTPSPVPTDEPPFTSSRSRRNKASLPHPSPIHPSTQTAHPFDPTQSPLPSIYSVVSRPFAINLVASPATNARRSPREIGALGVPFSRKKGRTSSSRPRNCRTKEIDEKGKGILLIRCGCRCLGTVWSTERSALELDSGNSER